MLFQATRKEGRAQTPAKAAASRANGKKGGRPRKVVAETRNRREARQMGN